MTWEIQIENIAGILEGQARLEPGLNAVQASNWQGKSSFIEALQTGLGTATTLMEGKASGSVQLRTPETDIGLELTRANGGVTVDGLSYLQDESDIARAALFACLGERNEVRQAVREGRNLEAVLLRPLDFENIDTQVSRLKREREQVDTELTQAKEARKRLPARQERVTQLEADVEELRERQAALEADSPEEAADSASPRQALSQAQANRDRAESQIDRLEKALERIDSRLEEHRIEREEIEVPDDESLEKECAAVRSDLEEVKQELEVLQTVYSTTELVLQEGLDLITDVNRELTGDSVICWTCGSETSSKALERRLEALGEKITETRTERETVQDRLDELEARREAVVQSRTRVETLTREIAAFEEQRADRAQRLEAAETRFETASQRVERLQASVDSAVEELTDVQSERKYREAELKDARNELEACEARVNQIETLTEERETIVEEIESLRTRKETIKQETRETFSEAIEEISARFETGFKAAHLTGDFELVVARDGRETSLEALSEGELELIGFIAALAGYEAFDVADVTPLLLVDGIGGLTDENVRSLVDYLVDRTEYLVFTTYPTFGVDADTVNVIDPTAWAVTSRESPTAE